MTSLPEDELRSPLFSALLKPRQTIESIVATQPRRYVLLLASLWAVAYFAGQILDTGAGASLFNWRVLLALAIGGPVFGIVSVYVGALVLSWIGSSMGGRASATELRAVLAWSATPGILGFLAVAVLFVALHGIAGLSGFSLLLRAIATICGIWSFILLLLMLSRVQQFGFWRTIANYLLALILPLAVALLVRTLVFQPFNIPASSMAPTLQVGDYLFVSKYAYGYSHFSLPFSPPLFSGRVFASEPALGDVVVFRLPKDEVTDFVKRIVGLPGDRIQMKSGLLYINDVPVQRERVADFVAGAGCGLDTAVAVKRWRETLPNGVSFETLDCVDNGFYDNTAVYNVPAGHYFLVGDNRDNSSDSRVLSTVGYIPFENLIGRVAMLFFSKAPDGSIRFERVGLMVH